MWKGDRQQILWASHQLGEVVDLCLIKPIKAAECLLDHSLPKGTLAKGFPTSAPLIFAKALLPDVPHLAYRVKPFGLPQELDKQGASTPPIATNIKNFNHLRRHH